MRRWLAGWLGLLVLTGLCACASSNAVLPTRLNREAILPLKTVQELTGYTLKLAYDRRDDRRGLVVWAWEEIHGEPRLLYVELYLHPANADALYEDAGQRAQVLTAPDGMQACQDGRSIFLHFGGYTARIVDMHTLDGKGALSALQRALMDNLPALPGPQETVGE